MEERETVVSEEAEEYVTWLLGGHKGGDFIKDTWNDVTQINFEKNDQILINKGGTLIKERYDDFYECFCVYLSDDEAPRDQIMKSLKSFKGLHRNPNIPCFTRNGIVSINEESLCTFLDSYFDHVGPVYHNLFGGDGVLRPERTTSLTAYRNSHISLNRPLYSTAPSKSELVEYQSAEEPSEIASSMSELFTCCICYEIMSDPAGLSCGHTGCKRCLETAFIKGNKCPLCQSPVQSAYARNLQVNVVIRDTIATLYPNANKGKAQVVNDDPLMSIEECLGSIKSIEDLKLASLADPRRYSKQRNDEMETAAAHLEELLHGQNQNDARRHAGHRRILRRCIKGISQFEIVKLYRKAGVLAESSLCYEVTRGILKVYLKDLLCEAFTNCVFRRSNIVIVDDVIASMPLGKTMLGFGGPHGIRYVWSDQIHRVLKQVHPTLEFEPTSLSVMNDITSYMLVKILECANKMKLKQRIPDTMDRELDEDGAIVDVRAFFAVSINAGADTEGGFSDNFKTRIYMHTEDDFMLGDGWILKPLDPPIDCLSSHEIQAAVHIVLSGQLARLAASEGTKAFTKFNKENGDTSVGMGRKAGLQFSPEHVSLIAGRLSDSYRLTAGAATYLAAVLEYLSAELLELSGNVGKDNLFNTVTPRHILLAISNDEELAKLFLSCTFRQAGIMPLIQSLLINTSPAYNFETFVSPFEIMMVQKALVNMSIGSKGTSFVDPRTGLHYAIIGKNIDESPTAEEFDLVPMPALDATTNLSIHNRMKMARDALTPEETALMKSEGYGAGIYMYDDDRLPANGSDSVGWSEESPSSIYNRNIREIRRMQKSTDLIFNINSFQLLVQELGQDLRMELYFTAEAMECIQTYAENYLFDLTQCAYLNAMHSRRRLLQPMDMELARRLRGERA